MLELEWMELDDIDTEDLVIPRVSSIKSGTPIMKTSRQFGVRSKLYISIV